VFVSSTGLICAARATSTRVLFSRADPAHEPEEQDAFITSLAQPATAVRTPDPWTRPHPQPCGSCRSNPTAAPAKVEGNNGAAPAAATQVYQGNRSSLHDDGYSVPTFDADAGPPDQLAWIANIRYYMSPSTDRA